MSDLSADARAAKQASRALSRVDGQLKDRVLRDAAARIVASTGALLAANALDVSGAEAAGATKALLDRLRLDEDRIEGIARAVTSIAALPDPVGHISELSRRPNGLVVGRMQVPLGLVAIVYESRPNVTAEAAALCFKSGNACVLRGGKEALHSNRVLSHAFSEALGAHGLDPALVTFVDGTDREGVRTLSRLSGVVDLLIPRGGESLIRFVVEHATVPVIQHYKGVCHVYVDAAADLGMAQEITLNAKVHRPGVCNALETLLVDAEIAGAFLPPLTRALRERGVELRGCERSRAVVDSLIPATDADWDAEYLDLILAIRVVDGLEGALDHIGAHGSNHTEAIVTNDHGRAERFVREVDASLVLVNASTRFNDGFELGLGAEMGISTSKLHAYGAMGLEELCTRKWIAYGQGQVRS
jgi:glutamate-5-semialdehyde dehydrogenase